jgi:hypothetical protein
MWQRWKRLKAGEKILFGLVALLIVVTVQNYAYLEYLRRTSDHPLFPIRTHYDFAGEGFHGSELFRKNNCTACHRAVGNGTNMGLNLDGIGSRRTLAYLEDFLRDPEATYPSKTIDHGEPPKDAAYVAALPSDDRRAIAIFLSQLTSDRGGVEASAPPAGKSSFIDAMLDMWAPDSWRMAFSDVRDADKKNKEAAKPQSEPSKPQGTPQ